MMGMADELTRWMNGWRMRPGEVVRKRRWFHHDWFIIVKKVDGTPYGRCITSRNKALVGLVVLVDDARKHTNHEKWPDAVCAAVAEWALTNG